MKKYIAIICILLLIIICGCKAKEVSKEIPAAEEQPVPVSEEVPGRSAKSRGYTC